jgi:hypothetical protein
MKGTSLADGIDCRGGNDASRRLRHGIGIG